MCVPNTKALQFIKKTLLQLKSLIDILKVGDFITLLMPIDRSPRQKLNRDMVNNIVNQMELAHI